MFKNFQALIAHRGASSEAPENTFSAIQRALQIGVDAIEIDVHLSRDGHLIVIHDANISRTTNAPADKKISEMSLAEIKTLDAGSWFSSSFANERLPTLTEVLAIDRGPTELMIEVKRGHADLDHLAEAVVKTLAAAQNILVGSFSSKLLEKVQKLNPKLPLIGIAEKEELLESFDKLNLKKMALWYKITTPALIKKYSQVWCFTVDDMKTAQFLTSIGVAGIITNRPGEMKSEGYFPDGHDR